MPSVPTPPWGNAPSPRQTSGLFDPSALANSIAENVARQAVAQRIEANKQAASGGGSSGGRRRSSGGGGGYSRRRSSGGGGGGGGGGGAVAQPSTASQFFSFSDSTVDKLKHELGLAGYEVYKMNRHDLYQAWSELSQMSDQYKANGKNLSPWDVLHSYGGKSLTRTEVTKDIDYTDPMTARGLVQKSMQNFLGRDPTNAEIASFTEALRQSEAQSPKTTTTSATTDPFTGKVTASSTTQGGFGPESAAMLAENRVKSTKEYGSVQAATTYMDALRQMTFGGPGGS